MNKAHGVLCSSGWWARTVERELLPWGLAGVDLGDHLLEIGPGFGATTRVLARRRGSLTVLELSKSYCERLRRTLDGDVQIVQADATDMPFADDRFSGVVCFTMLHHVPSRELQDRLLGEVSRVLRPGGVFAGTDSLGTGRAFKLLHIGDTLVPVSPEELPARLRRAGMVEPSVEASRRSFRFQAHKPPADATMSPPSGTVAIAVSGSREDYLFAVSAIGRRPPAKAACRAKSVQPTSEATSIAGKYCGASSRRCIP